MQADVATVEDAELVADDYADDDDRAERPPRGGAARAAGPRTRRRTRGGLTFGRPGSKPRIFTVPEPRNRDAVADMIAEFAPVLLDHVFSPEHSSLAVESADQPRPLRQVWLPNHTHLDMLHFLAYAYAFTKWGTAARVKLLNALGRAAGWLFREAQRPGQVFAMVATEALPTLQAIATNHLLMQNDS